MTLEELAALAPRSSHAAVPAWAQGCFHRRGAVFADGSEDTVTRAVRLQAHGLAGELRVSAARPDVSGREGFHACSVPELLELALVDGGVAEAAWADGALSRANGLHFQPHDAWPEPGALQRVGACLTETARNGAYALDWRLQPGSSGLLAGLRLMFETGLDGLTRPRDGGLLIAGDHCLFVLGRRRPLPSQAPVRQQMRAAGDPFAFADMAFDGEASYARRGPSGDFVVELSTNPFREGGTVAVTDGFLQTSITEILRQHIGEGDERIVRQWRIDTLMTDADLGLATATDKAGTAWLKSRAAWGFQASRLSSSTRSVFSQEKPPSASGVRPKWP
jgi:hypothetical protein